MSSIRNGEISSSGCFDRPDVVQPGPVDEDEVGPTVNRAYWEDRGSRETLTMTDELVAIVKSIDGTLDAKYNKFYIGLARNEQPFNFAIFRPKREWLRLEITLEKSDEVQKTLEDAGQY